MTHGRLIKTLGGLALLAPVASLAWAEDRAGHSPVQIYSTESVIQQATGGQTPPEQAVPDSTESKNGEAKNGNGEEKKEEESVGLLQECLDGQTCNWFKENRIKVSGHIEQSVTFNGDHPNDHLNFGRLFDDRSNDYRLNQAIFTFERALDPKPCECDWGFKFQFMYGSDARFIHVLGFMDNITLDTVQPDIVELFWNYHMPILTDGGVDVKIGQFVTLMGAEVIYAPANPLFSHSYIFNFGIPFKHVGALATIHWNDQIDVMLGITDGINTGAFDDNNDAPAFHGGITWTSSDKKAIVAASLHVGPEDPEFRAPPGVNANGDDRIIGDIVTTLKITDKLTYINDLNAGRDVGFDAEWFGCAQYLTYQINKCLGLVGRFEIFRDDDGFVVGQFAKNDDFINIERNSGNLSPNTLFGGDTTYTALTLGVNYKPYENLLFRPEVRWDWANKNHPFDDFTDNNQFTVGLEAIWFF